MRICPHCHEPINDDKEEPRFCPFCGSDLSKPASGDGAPTMIDTDSLKHRVGSDEEKPPTIKRREAPTSPIKGRARDNSATIIERDSMATIIESDAPVRPGAPSDSMATIIESDAPVRPGAPSDTGATVFERDAAATIIESDAPSMSRQDRPTGTGSGQQRTRPQTWEEIGVKPRRTESWNRPQSWQQTPPAGTDSRRPAASTQPASKQPPGLKIAIIALAAAVVVVAIVVAVTFSSRGGGSASQDSAATASTSGAANGTIQTTDQSTTDAGSTNGAANNATSTDANTTSGTISNTDATSSNTTSDSNANATPAPEPEPPAAPTAPPVFTSTDASSTLPGDEVTSYYGPNNIVDQDFMTAWNEGSDGDGTGEWVSINAASPQTVRGVRIVNGYPKSGEIFTKNNRCRDVTIQLSDGFEKHVTLADAYRDYQDFDLGGSHQTTFVRIRIDSIYRGSEWNDSSICELQAY